MIKRAISGSRNSRCKGPVAGTNWLLWRKDKASREASEEESREMWSENLRG